MNKAAVLDLIRRSPEGVSRAEIAQELAVSRATVSAIVDGLIGHGLVVERGAGLSRGGRRPIVLQVNGDAGRVLAVDLGASHVLVAVTDLLGRILHEAEAEIDITAGPQVCLAQVAALGDELLGRLRGGERLWAVSAGVPGPVITAQGVVSSPPIMPGWDGFPIRAFLEQRWGRPASVDNDADLGALGEWTFGAGRGQANLAYVKIGTGIGCGLLLDGRLFHGVVGTAGEIGHVTISPDGPPCTCGNYGCLEAMASGRAIAQRAHQAVLAGQQTALAGVDRRQALTVPDVVRAAQGGDAVSQQILADAGRHIGSAVASLINMINPGLVLLGGGVTDAGDFIMGPLREAAQARSLRAAWQVTRIERAALGRRASLMGAAALALEAACHDLLRPARAESARSPGRPAGAPAAAGAALNRDR